MRDKKIIARYRHLRVLITRARDDANRWGTQKKPLLLMGIKEQSGYDFGVYDKAYNKYVQKRVESMDHPERLEAHDEEIHKDKPKLTYTEIQLTRIANALEYLAQSVGMIPTDDKNESTG